MMQELLGRILSRNVNIAIALIAIPFLEVGTTILLTQQLGAVTTYTLFAVSNIIGLAILWVRWQRIKPFWSELILINQLSEEAKAARSADPEVMRHAADLVKFGFSVVLLLIPGFFTDLIAFYLMHLLAKSTDLQPTQGDS